MLGQDRNIMNTTCRLELRQEQNYSWNHYMKKKQGGNMGQGRWVMGGILVVSLKNNSGSKVIIIT